MNIYIPQHLRKIGVIKQLCQMVQAYGDPENPYYLEATGAFDNYKYCLKLDPVKRFLSLCIPESKYIDSDQDYDAVLSYLSALFYSVKGTLKVFEYMKKYLGLEFQGEIVYTTKYVEFSLKNLKVDDESIFSEAMRDFLNALLYFQEFIFNSNIIGISIESEIKNKLSAGIITYHLEEVTNKK